MRLYKIVLNNFRQYGKNEVIKFPKEGLIGVVGKNGAGKSTLFNAIGWCLYGKIKDVNKDMILNISADKKDECFVELFFELQGVKYHVKRDLKRTNECFLKTADGTPYAIGTSNLTSYIEENLFKMDYNAFCSCYYAEQDDFDNLVKLTPAKRVQTISKLLRVDDIDKAADSTRREYRGLKVEVDEARKYLRDEKELENQRRVFQTEVFNLQASIGKNEADLTNLTTEYKNSLVKKADGEKDYEKHKDLINNISNNKDKIQTLTIRSLERDKKELAKLQELKNRYDEIQKYKKVYHVLKEQRETMTNDRIAFNEKIKLEREISLLKKEIENYLSEFNSLKDKLKIFVDVEGQLKQSEEKLKIIEDEVTTIKESYQEKMFNLRSKKEKLNSLKEQSNKFNEMGKESPCETCGRPLGEHYDERMKDIKTEVNEIASAGKELQIEIKAMEEEIKAKSIAYQKEKDLFSSYQKSSMEKNNLVVKTGLVEKELNQRKERYENLQTEHSSLKDVTFNEETYQDVSGKLEKATKLYEEILKIEDSIKKIPELENSIKEVRSEIEKLSSLVSLMEKEKNELNFDESSYLTLDSKVKGLQDTIQLKKDEKSKMEIHIQSFEKDIAIIDEKILENEKMTEEIRKKEKDMLLLGKLDAAYKQYKSDILSKLAPTISEIMSNDIDVMTNNKYNQIELDDEYNIYIYRDGEKKPLPFFSGGEKKLASLCQRLAISSLLVSQTGQESFDMLAMDEVFGSLDDERQDNVIDMLRNLNEKFPQILIVTHSENVKGLFDHLIEIKQDEKNNSTFNWLTEWDVSDIDEELEEFIGFEEIS